MITYYYSDAIVLVVTCRSHVRMNRTHIPHQIEHIGAGIVISEMNEWLCELWTAAIN